MALSIFVLFNLWTWIFCFKDLKKDIEWVFFFVKFSYLAFILYWLYFFRSSFKILFFWNLKSFSICLRIFIGSFKCMVFILLILFFTFFISIILSSINTQSDGLSVNSLINSEIFSALSDQLIFGLIKSFFCNIIFLSFIASQTLLSVFFELKDNIKPNFFSSESFFWNS